MRHKLSLRRQWENGVNLPGPGAGEQVGDKFYLAVVFVPAQHSQQHYRVMHVAFAVAVVGVLRQHGAELLEFPLAPQLDHAFVHLMIELAGVAVHPLFRPLVVNKTMRQRTAGEHRYGAVIFLNRLNDRFSQLATVGKVVNGAERRDGDHFEVLIAVHIAHRHQSAVLQLQAWDVVRFGAHAELDRFVGDKVPQLRIAVIVIGHVANKVRQFVAGIDPLEMVGTVNVVGAVHQPVGVEHNNGVDAHFATTLANLDMSINGSLTTAVIFSRQFRKIH
ncbi:hypothetical protein SARI_01897 [Salmonella enterica subsp. arizonae serovar 62:z4,z23:-]|uniref:Uncharacterized protein n=1 Tax=Salmonella arizonae (strain ATCC BAA-731 / CDC346-86 / RSK2980) TaxID=41514 RepID=A9MH62_SALAR|nr:hypothetical protein SARI_01897 [Salmonella enterica subsp. arizonae serovar 62:z4,z23:-]